MVRLQGRRLDASAAELAMLRTEHAAQTKKYNAVKARITAAEARRAAAEERAARTETERAVAMEELLDVETRLETVLGEAGELRAALAAGEVEREVIVAEVVALRLAARRGAAATKGAGEGGASAGK